MNHQLSMTKFGQTIFFAKFYFHEDSGKKRKVLYRRNAFIQNQEKKEDKIKQVEIYERDAFMTTQEKSKILCRLKYTKESFALNIQTNNITWDLWRYVAGILSDPGSSAARRETMNKTILEDFNSYIT